MATKLVISPLSRPLRRVLDPMPRVRVVRERTLWTLVVLAGVMAGIVAFV